MKLPRQLQNKAFRFIKIQTGTKRPSENAWAMENNYKYNETPFIEYLKNAKSFGIVAGFAKLAIIDCDEKELVERIEKELPATFTVKTGSGGKHFYYIIKNLDKKIIVINDDNVHFGEVQFTGAQCIGPGSLHPSGALYEVFNDAPIASINKKDLLAAVKPFMKAEDIIPCLSGKEFDISLVADHIKELTFQNGELTGPHPLHGSKNGANIRINKEKNMWFCFRCETGGDALSLVAMLEKVVPCEDLKPGYFKTHKEEFKQTLKIATEKYGYEDAGFIEKKKQFALSRDLTAEEVSCLKDPKLLFNILREAQKEGIVGEEGALISLINRISMRCVTNITKTSGNILVSDNTGLGKDNIVKKLCNVMLIPEKTLYEATCVSEKVLNYWHPGYEGASWDGRVMYLQDPPAETLKGQAFRVRASGDNHNRTLDTDRKVQTIKIIGKPIIIITSMNATIDEELVRRWNGVRLDPSAELTAAIIKYAFAKAAGEVLETPNEVLRNAVRNLPCVSVTIPYANELNSLIPVENSLMRTQVFKLIDIIKASAALHQFQRKKDGDTILANKDDLECAVIIINWCNVLTGQVLTRKQADLVEYLRKRGKLVPFKEIITDNKGMSEAWVYRQEKDLVERRILQMVPIFDIAIGREVKAFTLDTIVKMPIKMPKGHNYTFTKQLEKDIKIERGKHKLCKLNLR